MSDNLLSQQDIQKKLAVIRDSLDQHGLEYFIVVGNKKAGASIYNGRNNNGAAKHARDAHMQWEKTKGIDSKHDWSK